MLKNISKTRKIFKNLTLESVKNVKLQTNIIRERNETENHVVAASRLTKMLQEQNKKHHEMRKDIKKLFLTFSSPKMCEFKCFEVFKVCFPEKNKII